MLAIWRDASNLVPRVFRYNTCGWLGPRPQGFARVPFVHFQIIDLKYFRLATLMALSVSFSASLYQLQSRDVPRVLCEQSLLRSSYLGKIEATLLAEYPPGRGWYPRPRGHVFTVSLGLVTLIGNINSSILQLCAPAWQPAYIQIESQSVIIRVE